MIATFSRSFDDGGITAISPWLSGSVRAFRSPHARADAEGIKAISRWLSEERATPPDHRTQTGSIPEGCQQPRFSVQIPVLVFHSRCLEELRQLFAKSFHAMVFGLVRNVIPNLRPSRRAHGEGTVSFLPREAAFPDFIPHPDRRRLLQFAHEIRETMGRFQSDQEMHVVGDAADALGETSETVHRSTEVFVEFAPPVRMNAGDAVLGGKDQVVMQSKEGRGHSGGWLASLRDARIFRMLTGGVASLNHRLMAAMPPASFGGGGSWTGGVSFYNRFDWNI